MIHWHRLLGLTLTDFFTGAAYRVELEKDLSLKQQLLDVVSMEEIFAMPYTVEDFKRDYAREYIDTLTPEERLEGISDEELLKLIKKRLSSKKVEKLLEMLSKKTPDN
jgi:hypothetical protein